MASRQLYKNPPIEEAVCELRFNESGWDITWPGQLFNLIKDEYSGKPRSQQQSIVAIEPGTGLTIKPEIMKTQLVSPDGRRLVAIAPGAFSLHELRPYSGWESYREKIMSSVRSFLQVATEIAISRIGLRYVNRISLSKGSADLSEFFNCIPNPTGGLPESVVRFFATVDLAYPQQDSIVRVTFASSDGSDGELVVMLDIDAIWENQADPLILTNENGAIKKFQTILSELRERERDVFEALITDKTRKTFDAEVPAA